MKGIEKMIIYFDCISGSSGDMTLGAFIDLGVPVEWLKETLAGMPLTGFNISVTSEKRNGIAAKSVHVHTEDDTGSRSYGQIQELIGKSQLPESVKDLSLKIFGRIAEAEAGIHDHSIENVHFHEVGSMDAIVDIVGTALCVEHTGVKKMIASRIPLGSGFTECSHGTIPVPAPATIEILKNIPVYGTGIKHELVTPTGAAIIATLAESYQDIPEMLVQKIAYGAGKREMEERPNVLRLVKGTETFSEKNAVPYKDNDFIIIVETNIDDMNPEIYGYLMERLFDDGALDVCIFPVFMKKNRPGNMVQVLCRQEATETIIHRILSETTSLGVRYYTARRETLVREKAKVDTSFGGIYIKRVVGPDGETSIVPEYEVCRKIAIENNIPIIDVYNLIAKEGASSLKKS